MGNRAGSLVAAAGILGIMGLWLVVAMTGAAGVGGTVGHVAASVVIRGMWARAETPGVTPMAADVVVVRAVTSGSVTYVWVRMKHTHEVRIKREALVSKVVGRVRLWLA